MSGVLICMLGVLIRMSGVLIRMLGVLILVSGVSMGANDRAGGAVFCYFLVKPASHLHIHATSPNRSPHGVDYTHAKESQPARRRLQVLQILLDPSHISPGALTQSSEGS